MKRAGNSYMFGYDGDGSDACCGCWKTWIIISCVQTHNSVLQAYGSTNATVRGIGWSVFTASGWAAWGIGFACSVCAVY